MEAIDNIYGPKKDLVLMDNNVVASPRLKEIIAEIRDLGFMPGAKAPASRRTCRRWAAGSTSTRAWMLESYARTDVSA